MSFVERKLDFANIYELGLSAKDEHFSDRREIKVKRKTSAMNDKYSLCDTEPDGSSISHQNILHFSNIAQQMNERQGTDKGYGQKSSISRCVSPFDAFSDGSTDLLSAPSLSFDTLSTSTSSNSNSYDKFSPIQKKPSYEIISTEILNYYDASKSTAAIACFDQSPFSVLVSEEKKSVSSLKQIEVDVSCIGVNMVSPLSTHNVDAPQSNIFSESKAFMFESNDNDQFKDIKSVFYDEQNTEDAHVTDVDSAMKKLVNLEDINETNEQISLTMKPPDNASDNNKEENRNRGIPPKSAPWYGNQTLGEIQALRKNVPAKKLVMMPPTAVGPNTSALVVCEHGQSHGYGPPPIMNQVGFGVGAQVQYDYMKQQNAYCQQ